MPPPLCAAASFALDYRVYCAEDFDFIEALYLSTRDAELALSGWPEAEKNAFLTQQHRAQHHHYQTYYPNAERLILERAGAPIGRLYLDPWPRELRIIDIALVPAARGQGIGEAVLRDVIAWAEDQAKGVSIHVEKFNPAPRLRGRRGQGRVRADGARTVARCSAIRLKEDRFVAQPAVWPVSRRDDEDIVHRAADREAVDRLRQQGLRRSCEFEPEPAVGAGGLRQGIDSDQLERLRADVRFDRKGFADTPLEIAGRQPRNGIHRHRATFSSRTFRATSSL